jgi:hypothetical protein
VAALENCREFKQQKTVIKEIIMLATLCQSPVRRFLVIFCMLTGFTISAGAQSSQTKIPPEFLELDHQRCMNGCVPGFGEKTCKPLCDCTVNEFKNKMSYDKYLDLSVQLSKSDVSPEMRSFLDEVANFCTAEIDRLGIEIGEGAPKSAAPQ